VLRSKTIPLIAVMALFIPACGDDDDDGGGESVAVGEYASDICTAFFGWRDAIQEGQTDLASSLESDAAPQEGKDALQGFLDNAVAASDQLIEDVEAAGTPDTENGEEAADVLQTAAEQARDRLADAQADVGDLPTDSPEAFSAAAAQFGNDVQAALGESGEGLQDVDSPELNQAFDEEEACQG
jgi:hypothetical protein